MTKKSNLSETEAWKSHTEPNGDHWYDHKKYGAVGLHKDGWYHLPNNSHGKASHDTPFKSAKDAIKHAEGLAESTTTMDLGSYTPPMAYPLKRKSKAKYSEDVKNVRTKKRANEENLRENIKVAAELKRMRELI